MWKFAKHQRFFNVIPIQSDEMFMECDYCFYGDGDGVLRFHSILSDVYSVLCVLVR